MIGLLIGGVQAASTVWVIGGLIQKYVRNKSTEDAVNWPVDASKAAKKLYDEQIKGKDKK